MRIPVTILDLSARLVATVDALVAYIVSLKRNDRRISGSDG